MESGLTFNQLICEFESRHPCQKPDTEKGRYGEGEIDSRQVRASSRPDFSLSELCGL